MAVPSRLGESLYIPPKRPDRRLISFFVKNYLVLGGIFTTLIIVTTLHMIHPWILLGVIALLGAFLWFRTLQMKDARWKSFYHSTTAQIIQSTLLITGTTIFLWYVYRYTNYLSEVKVDTLWLLYLMVIWIISQHSSRFYFLILLGIILLALYIVTPYTNGPVLFNLPYPLTPLTLEFLIKSLWLISLASLTYILFRYLGDAVADMHLIVDVQNHIRQVESRLLRDKKDFDEMEYLAKCVQVIRDDLHYDHVFVFKLDRFVAELTCVAAASEIGRELVQEKFTIKVPEKPSFIGTVVQTGKYHVSNNVKTDPIYLPHQKFLKTQSELVVPIRSRGRLYGVLDIQVETPDYFLDQDIHATEILANNLGWVVDNSDQFEHINWLNRMMEKIAMPILTQTYLDDTLQEIADTARIELGADLVMLYSFDPGTPDGVVGPIYAGQPLHPELLKNISDEKDNAVYRLLFQGAPIHCQEDLNKVDVSIDPLFGPSSTHRATGRPTFIEREQVRSNVVVRLLSGEKCLGVLFLNFLQPRTFTFWDKKRYFSFANLAALAIQKMQSQQHEIQLEMTDLSRRIHDTLIGDTLGLYKVLNSIEVSGGTAKMKKLQDAIEIAKDLTDHLHGDIRYISGLLEGTHTDDMQIELDKLSIIFHQAFKLHMNLDWKVDPTYLPSALSRELFLVVREAITNTAKHARATTIDVIGQVQTGRLHIRVSDNGQGFDPGQVRRVNGLNNMKHRMQELGGDFAIESEPGRGTTIDLSVPVSKSA